VSLTQDSELETDQLIESLKKAAGLETPHVGELAKWREGLEKHAYMFEGLAERYKLKAAELREKIRAADVLLDVGSNAAPAPQVIGGQSSGSFTSLRGGPQTQRAHEFDPDQLPDLRHTRVLLARFGKEPASGWNKLVHAAHLEALSRMKSFDALRAATSSNLIKGRASSEETKKGYRYVPQIDISIQNVDASHAWSNALRLARHLEVEIAVDFEWMNKAESSYPGMKGRLSWKP
jgi:hypothetical protein